MVDVEGLVDFLSQPRANFRLVAVADRLHEQVLEARLLEDFAQDVEYTALQSLAFDLQLLQQAVVNVAFTRFFCHEVPEVANLGLTDAVNTTETLLQPVRIPGQIVIDHQDSRFED